MDTMWFAVDKDGCIAAFESQEGGAVPEAALSDQVLDVLGVLSEDANKTDIVYAHEDRRCPLHQNHLHTQPRKKWRPPPPKSTGLNKILAKFGLAKSTNADECAEDTEDHYELHTPLIMFVDRRDDVEQFLEGTEYQIVQANEGCAVIFRTLSIDDHKALHDRNICRACVEIYSDFNEEDPFRENPSLIGLYFYSCCEGQMAYPYGRVSLPETPMRLDQLPSDLQKRLKQVSFTDISFAETAFIQPAERVKSVSWDGGYLSVDWKHYRTNPGQEEEYRDLYDANKEYGEVDGIEYDPPERR